jgi:hypothetical protein
MMYVSRLGVMFPSGLRGGHMTPSLDTYIIQAIKQPTTKPTNPSINQSINQSNLQVNHSFNRLTKSASHTIVRVSLRM